MRNDRFEWRTPNSPSRCSSVTTEAEERRLRRCTSNEESLYGCIGELDEMLDNDDDNRNEDNQARRRGNVLSQCRHDLERRRRHSFKNENHTEDQQPESHSSQPTHTPPPPPPPPPLLCSQMDSKKNPDHNSNDRLNNIDQLLEDSLEEDRLSHYELPISNSLKGNEWGKLPFYDCD